MLALTGLYFLRCYYIHFLMSLIERGYFNGFKIFTCFCCCKMRTFMRANMNRDVFFTQWKVGVEFDEDPFASDKEGDQSQLKNNDITVISELNPLE